MLNPAKLPPGFRFHPTDEELVLHYLRNRAASLPCPVPIIAELDIYKFNPWELPPMAAMQGDRVWYFFTPRDRKYPNGIRPNRATSSGYWKATGTDKQIKMGSGRNEVIGVKKALVFYKGKPPKGVKTEWIMHEYRLVDSKNCSPAIKPLRPKEHSMRLDDWVLCKIYKKNNHHLYLDQNQEDKLSETSKSEASSSRVCEEQSSNIHKSSSLSEFLNILFDNPSEILMSESSGRYPISGQVGYLTNAAAVEGLASGKRPHPTAKFSEECGVLIQPCLNQERYL